MLYMMLRRPRKPEDDTIAYFRGLEVPLRSEDDLDAREALVINLFDEIKQREASLATHRKCSVLLEAALRLAPSRCVVRAAERMVPYCGFLACDRYGSHVLQTATALLLGAARGEGASEDDGEEEEEDQGEAGEDGAVGRGTVAERAAAVGERLFEVLVRAGFWDVVFQPSGAHVIRTLLSSMLGHDEEQGRKRVAAAAAAPPADADGDADAEADAAGAAAVRAAATATRRRGSAGKGLRKRSGKGDAVAASAAADAADASASSSSGAAAAAAAAAAAPSSGPSAVALRGPGAVLRVPSGWAAAAANWSVMLASCGPQAVEAASEAAPCGFITHALDRWREACRVVRHAVNRQSRAATKKADKEAAEADLKPSRRWATVVDRATDATALTLLGWPAPSGRLDVDETWLSWLVSGPDPAAAEAACTGRVTSRAAEAGVRACGRRALSLGVCRALLLPLPVSAALSKRDKRSPPATASAGLLTALSSHYVGNFVVQAALAAVSGAHAGHATTSVEAGAALAPSKPVLAAETEAMVDALAPGLGEILVARLDGVAWRVAQAAASLGSGSSGKRTQKDVIAALVGSVPETGGPGLMPPAARLAVWLMDADNWRGAAAGGGWGADHDEGEDAARAYGGSVKRRSKGGRKGSAPARGTSVSAAGVKTLSVCAACFESPAQRPLVESLAAVPGEALVSIARSPWGSRHLLEPLLSLSEPATAWVSQRLARAVRGCWADLAQDRMSAWVVSRAFEAGDARMKERIATALLPAERALQGSPFGRKIAASVKLDHFVSHRASWKSAVQQASQRESKLKALVDEVDQVAAAAVAKREAKEEAEGAAREAEEAEEAKKAKKAKKAEAEAEAAEEAARETRAKQAEARAAVAAAERRAAEQARLREAQESESSEDSDESDEEVARGAGATAVKPAPATASSKAAAAAASPSDSDDDSDSDSDSDDGAAARADDVVASLGAAASDPFATLLRGRTIEIPVADDSDSDSDEDTGDRASKRARSPTPEPEAKPQPDSMAGRRQAGEAIRRSLALAASASAAAPVGGAAAAPAKAAPTSVAALNFLFGGKKAPSKQRASAAKAKASSGPPAKRAKPAAEPKKAAAPADAAEGTDGKKKRHRGSRGGRKRKTE